VLVALVAVAVLLVPLVAGAHVDVEPAGDVTTAGLQAATLRVPNECEGSETTSVELGFPSDPPVTTVEVTPVPGWTATDTRVAGDAVTTLTLTGVLGGDDAQEFALLVGLLPAGTTALPLTAVQRCASGDVIRWVEPTPPGGPEPARPAPVLEIQGAAAIVPSSTTTSSVVPSTTSTVPPTTTARDTAGSDEDSTGVVVAIAVAAVVVVGGIAFAVTRRR
jgi:uncharacterized protein